MPALLLRQPADALPDAPRSALSGSGAAAFIPPFDETLTEACADGMTPCWNDDAGGWRCMRGRCSPTVGAKSSPKWSSHFGAGTFPGRSRKMGEALGLKWRRDEASSGRRGVRLALSCSGRRVAVAP